LAQAILAQVMAVHARRKINSSLDDEVAPAEPWR